MILGWNVENMNLAGFFQLTLFLNVSRVENLRRRPTFQSHCVESSLELGGIVSTEWIGGRQKKCERNKTTRIRKGRSKYRVDEILSRTPVSENTSA